jgi:hypothetical protein
MKTPGSKPKAEEKPAQNRYLQIRDHLNQVSPSFCMAKWLQVTLHLHSGTNHSCHHPAVHPIPLKELNENPSALHNTPFKKARQKMMKDGVRPSECGYCWTIEDLKSDEISDRYIKSSEAWAAPYFKDIVALPDNADILPTYVEVSFSRTCNFKCSYCSPAFSTRWAQELKQQGPYEVSPIFEKLDERYEEDQNPYIQAFWKWWPELKKTLKVFRITGGEPLLSPNTFRILEELRDGPAPKLEIAINSNLGAPSSQIERFIELAHDLTENGKVAGLQVFTSVEAWGGRAEYIRHGMKFDYFWSNVETLLQRLPKADIIFMCAYNALSVTSFSDLLARTLELRKKYFRPNLAPSIALDIPYLRNPTYQAANVLTPDFLEKAKQSLKFMEENSYGPDRQWGYLEHEIAKMGRICQWMKQPMPEDSLRRHRREFFSFFSEHDRRRNTDFLATFPEYRDFYSQCRDLYENESTILRPRAWINRLRSNFISARAER